MRSPDVDALLAARDHPRAPAIERLRALLLEHPAVTERVKWNSPSYALDDDFATMQLRRDDVVQLVLHSGAAPKPEHPTIETGPLPSFARCADRNRIVLTIVGTDTDLDAEATDAVRALLHRWIAQLG